MDLINEIVSLNKSWNGKKTSKYTQEKRDKYQYIYLEIVQSYTLSLINSVAAFPCTSSYPGP